MQECGPTAQRFGDDEAGIEVHRNRKEILDDDQIQVMNCDADVGETQRGSGADCEAWQHMIGWLLTRDRADVMSEFVQGSYPLCSNNRDAVGSTESK